MMIYSLKKYLYYLKQ